MRTFKALPFLLSLALLLPFLSSTAASAEAPAAFSFTGSGYGHGVGMSQIGAKARALTGESATAILNYYYKNVQVAPIVDTQTIRVNIGRALKTMSLVSPTPDSVLQIFSGDIAGAQDVPPILTLGAKKKIVFGIDGAFAVAEGLRAKAFTIRWSGPATVITFSQPGSAVKYKYGQIQVKVVKGAMEVTNTLALRDEYLWGISEVPSSWPAAALEAQVIASRSYALSKLGKINSECDCQVYSHIADQNFVGFSKESEPRFGHLWKAAVSRTIIDTTTSLAIVSNGKPIQAYFFSSSGGATQTTSDAWGQATSYTQSVLDPAGLDPKNNPRFATWSASADQALVAKAFLLADIVTLEIMSRNTAGAVTYIKGTASDGSTKLLRGDTFRSRVKIPSPYFNLAG
jgi:SpoIID/LytB domain protein